MGPLALADFIGLDTCERQGLPAAMLVCSWQLAWVRAHAAAAAAVATIALSMHAAAAPQPPRRLPPPPRCCCRSCLAIMRVLHESLGEDKYR